MRPVGPRHGRCCCVYDVSFTQRHFGAPTQASLRSLRKPGCVRRARTPVTSVGDYWIPGSLAALGPRNDEIKGGSARTLLRGGGSFFDEAVIEGAREIQRGSLELLIEGDEHVGSRFHSRRRNDAGVRIDLLVGLESCEIKRSVAEKISSGTVAATSSAVVLSSHCSVL